MKLKEFFGKFKSLFLWGNLLAMTLVVVGLGFGVKYGLEAYTQHDESVSVPDLTKLSASDARRLLEEKGLEMMVADSGYKKELPADRILAQSPNAGMKVKFGRTIYVTVNSPSSPSFPIPDLIDNSSYREAEARLTALGFKLLPPKRIIGERDWVYGILCRGRHVNAGDQIPIESTLTLLIGNGLYGEDEDIDDIDSDYDYPEERIDELGKFEDIPDPEQLGTGNETDNVSYDEQ